MTNTKTAHTPGPWREFQDEDSHDIIAPDGSHIATMEGGPHAIQDARLIAAAPELLEAAKALLSLNRTQGVTEEVYEAAEQALDAAIARATQF